MSHRARCGQQPGSSAVLHMAAGLPGVLADSEQPGCLLLPGRTSNDSCHSNSAVRESCAGTVAADIWVLCLCRCNLHLRTPSELFSGPVQEDAHWQPSCCDLKTTSILLPWPCTRSSTSPLLPCLLHQQICPGIHWHRPWSSAYLKKDESSLYKR